MDYYRGMENYSEPCEYCLNYNELCDALNLIETLEETVQSTWDGIREMLEEIAQALELPTIGSKGIHTNGELTQAIISKIKKSPQTLTVAESADALYFSLHEIIGGGERSWPTELVIDGQAEILNQSLDLYEKAKRAI